MNILEFYEVKKCIKICSKTRQIAPFIGGGGVACPRTSISFSQHNTYATRPNTLKK